MKYLLSICLICMSSLTLAWECGSYDKYGQPIQKHLEIATDVLIGTVIEGKLEGSSNIKLKFKITLPVKGSLTNEIELTTGSDSPGEKFYIGGNYVVFLYGSNEIDFCNMVFELWTPINSLEELNEYAKRKDIELIEKVEVIAKFLEQNP